MNCFPDGQVLWVRHLIDLFSSQIPTRARCRRIVFPRVRFCELVIWLICFLHKSLPEQDVDEYVTKFAQKTKNTDGIWRVCRFFGTAPYCNRFLQVLQLLFETLKSFQDASKNFEKFSGCFKNGRFTVGSAYPHTFSQILSNFNDLGWHDKANTGVRWVHITTRNETSQNRPRPRTINTGKRWSYSNFTIRHSLRYFLQG